MSKSAAAVFPLSVILIDFLKHRNWDRQAIIDKIPFFALSIIFGILAIKSQNATESIAGFETFTLYQRFMFASFGAIIYPLKFLIPNELTCYHPYPHLVDNGTRLPYIWYAFPAIFALVLCLILWTIKKARWVIFGFGFYLVNVVLVLQFVSVGSAIYAERYSYVAYIGLAFLVAKGLVWLADNYKNYATITYSIFGALAIVLCCITFNQNKTWKNPESLWDKFTEVYPKDPYGMVKVAEYYMRFDDHEKTLGQFKKTADKFPGHARSYAGMGNMYGKMGKYQEAINSFNLAEKVAQQTKTGVAELYPNRAITYSIMKQYEKAFPDYEKAIKADPKNYRIRVNRAFAFLDNGNYPEAIEEYSFVLQFEPNNPNHYFFRGIAYQNTQQFEKALSDYSTNINLNPKNPNTYHNRGICYEQLKQYKLALQDILTAQKLGKPENQLYINKLTQLANY